MIAYGAYRKLHRTRQLLTELLNPMLGAAQLRDIDIALIVHGDGRGFRELPIAIAAAAPCEQETSLAVEFADAVPRLRVIETPRRKLGYIDIALAVHARFPSP